MLCPAFGVPCFVHGNDVFGGTHGQDISAVPAEDGQVVSNFLLDVLNRAKGQGLLVVYAAVQDDGANQAERLSATVATLTSTVILAMRLAK